MVLYHILNSDNVSFFECFTVDLNKTSRLILNSAFNLAENDEYYSSNKVFLKVENSFPESITGQSPASSSNKTTVIKKIVLNRVTVELCLNNALVLFNRTFLDKLSAELLTLSQLYTENNGIIFYKTNREALKLRNKLDR